MISAINDEIAFNLNDLIVILKKNSFCNVELRKIGGKYLHEISSEVLKRYALVLKKENIKVTLIDSPIGKNKFSNAYELELFGYYLEICKSFQCNFLRIFSNVGSNIIQTLSYYNYIARNSSIYLLLENEKGTFGEKGENILSIMEKKFSNIFHLFDVENYNNVGENEMDVFLKLQTYIKYIHLRDVKKRSGEYVIPFEGDLKIKELIAQLDSDVVVSLETHLPMVSNEDRAILFNKCLKRLKNEQILLW